MGLLALATIVLAFTASRAVFIGPNSADIGVWINIQEWLGRGLTLYSEVWDHKDWGFFVAVAPFYRAASILGVYVSGVAVTAAFAAGMTLLLRPFAPPRVALLIGLLATASYVAAPSYLAVYTENYAIATAVLAAGVLYRFPFVAGILFAGAVSIKLSALLLWPAALAADGLVWLCARRARVTVFRPGHLRRAIAGFALAAGLLLAGSWWSGTLAGWIDVASFNREYAGMRRGPGSPLAAFTMPDSGVAAFFLALASVFAGGLLIGAAPIAQAPAGDDGPVGAWMRFRALLLSVAVALGSLVAILLQAPPAWHHFQFLVGPSVAVAFVMIAIGWARTRSSLARCLLLLLMLVPLAVITRVRPGLPTPREALANLRAWSSLNDPGPAAAVLRSIGPGKSVAFFGGNGSRADARALPTGTRLACRFVYQFPHLWPRYGSEIEQCLSRHPDLVVVETSESWGTGSLRGQVVDALHAAYTACGPGRDGFALWARAPADCPAATATVGAQ